MRRLILILFFTFLVLPSNIEAAANCVAGGGNGICSEAASCSTTTGIWYNVYSPVNICLGAGNGCCVPDQSAAENGGPLCGGGEGVNTAFGCLMAGNPKKLVSQLLGWGVSVGGGIAFLMVVFAGFQMTTAAGDPKRVQAAKELLMSAIGGLILIVLSVVLLNFLGVSILGLGSLGFRI